METAKQIRSQALNKVYYQFRRRTDDLVWNQIWNQILDQICDQVHIFDQVWNQIG
jgi:hypothetical protein